MGGTHHVPQSRRACTDCGHEIPVLAPILMMVIPTKAGEDHVGTQTATRWCAACATTDKAMEAIKAALRGTREDYSEWHVELKASAPLLTTLVRQFIAKGYAESNISAKAVRSKNMVSARRWLPYSERKPKRAVVGWPVTIRRHFGLPAVTDL